MRAAIISARYSNTVLKRLRKYPGLRIRIELTQDQNLQHAHARLLSIAVLGLDNVDALNLSENAPAFSQSLRVYLFGTAKEEEGERRSGEVHDDDSTNGSKAALPLLGRLSSLRTLNIAKVELCSNSSVEISLRCLSRIEVLGLQSNNLGADGARKVCSTLRFMPRLRRLNMSANAIGVSGAMSLGDALTKNSCPELEHLYLYANKLQNEGVTALSWALPHIPKLVRFNLSSNEIGVTGARALARTLSRLKHLKWLNLMSNRVGDEGATSLAPHLPPTFSLNNNAIGFEGAGKIVKVLSHRARRTTKIWLSGNRLGPEGARVLAASLPSLGSTLHFLDISNNRFGKEGAVHLSRSLHRMRCLKHLAISQNSLGLSGVNALSRSLHALVDLESLSICEEKMLPAATAALASCISNMSKLVELNLFASGIGPLGMKSLASALQRGTRPLAELKISFSHIQDSGIEHLCESLPNLPSLRRLELQWNQMTNVGIARLSRAIANGHLAKLEHLNLGWNDIREDGAVGLASSLSKCTRLKWLGLEATSVNTRGAVALFLSVPAIPALESLSLGRCGIDDSSVPHATRAFSRASSKRARRLDLRSNRFTEDGKKSLKAALSAHLVLVL
eukprot:g3956.t1